MNGRILLLFLLIPCWVSAQECSEFSGAYTLDGDITLADGIITTQDGGYIISGNNYTGSENSFRLMKTNTYLQSIWNKRIDPTNQSTIRCSDIQELSSGNIVFTGYYTANENDTAFKYSFIALLDGSGQIEWIKGQRSEIYAGGQPSGDLGIWYPSLPEGSILEASDGGFYVALTFRRNEMITCYDIHENSPSWSYTHLTKFDNSGVVEWMRRMNTCNFTIHELINANNGNIYAIGYGLSPYTNNKYCNKIEIIMELKTDGEILKQRAFLSDSYNRHFLSIAQGNDDDIILGLGSDVNAYADYDETGTILKLDTNFSIKWNRTYGLTRSPSLDYPAHVGVQFVDFDDEGNIVAGLYDTRYGILGFTKNLSNAVAKIDYSDGSVLLANRVQSENVFVSFNSHRLVVKNQEGGMLNIGQKFGFSYSSLYKQRLTLVHFDSCLDYPCSEPIRYSLGTTTFTHPDTELKFYLDSISLIDLPHFEIQDINTSWFHLCNDTLTTCDWYPNVCDSTITPCDNEIVTTDEDCPTCIGQFAPIPDEKYVFEAWVREEDATALDTTYMDPQLKIRFTDGLDNQIGSEHVFSASGPIIEGWQQISDTLTVPINAVRLNMDLFVETGQAYFDDIRVSPFNSALKTYVYDQQNMRLVAELDERNFATYYQYDEEGRMVAIKKETNRGIKTIQSTQQNTSTNNAE